MSSSTLRRRRTPGAAPEPPKPEPQETIPAVQLDDAEDKETARLNKVIARFKAAATNRKSAIRAHCVECMGGAVQEVQRCKSVNCALYPFRMGENPNDARTIAAKAKKEAEAAAQKPEPAARPARRRSR